MKILLHLRIQVETLYKPVLCVETEGTNLAAYLHGIYVEQWQQKTYLWIILYHLEASIYYR